MYERNREKRPPIKPVQSQNLIGIDIPEGPKPQVKGKYPLHDAMGPTPKKKPIPPVTSQNLIGVDIPLDQTKGETATVQNADGKVQKVDPKELPPIGTGFEKDSKVVITRKAMNFEAVKVSKPCGSEVYESCTTTEVREPTGPPSVEPLHPAELPMKKVMPKLSEARPSIKANPERQKTVKDAIERGDENVKKVS